MLTLRYVLKHSVGCVLNPQTSSVAGSELINSAMQALELALQQPLEAANVVDTAALEKLEEAPRRSKSQIWMAPSAKVVPKRQTKSCPPAPSRPVQLAGAVKDGSDPQPKRMPRIRSPTSRAMTPPSEDRQTEQIKQSTFTYASAPSSCCVPN